MNINSPVENALSGVGCPIRPIKVTDGKKPETYITYYTYLETGELYGDDEELTESTFGTIDIFSKINFKRLVDEVKRALKKAGFTVVSSGPEMWEDDTGYYHVPVDFFIESESGLLEE